MGGHCVCNQQRLPAETMLAAVLPLLAVLPVLSVGLYTFMVNLRRENSYCLTRQNLVEALSKLRASQLFSLCISTENLLCVELVGVNRGKNTVK